MPHRVLSFSPISIRTAKFLLHVRANPARAHMIPVRIAAWLFVLVGPAAFSVAGLAQDSSALFTSVAAPYVSSTSLDITVSGTVGQGSAKLTVNGHLVTTLGKSAVLTLTTDTGAITERYTVSDGVTTCSVIFLRPSSKNAPSELCGTPVPWFAPFAFLSAVSPRRLSFDTSNDANRVLIYAFNKIGTSSTSTPQMASHSSSPRLHVDTNSHLVQLEYPVPSHGRQQYSNHISATYSDYVTVSGVPLPTHVQQTLDGTPSFDLTYSYSAGGSQ